MNDDLRDEYTFDYRQAKPNRFAASVRPVGRQVTLAPDVAAAFPDEAAVNAALRAYLKEHPPEPAPA